MTGIVIITASQEEAYRDYKRTVEDGVEADEIADFLEQDVLALLADDDQEGVRIWGTTVESKWQRVEPNDIVLIYRDGKFVSQARVVHTEENLELAEHLWKRDDHSWDEENPWRFLVFLDQFVEVDVSIEAFNSLIGYKEDYIPQGFTRVADSRVENLVEEFDSVENAITELTGKGEKVQRLETEDDEDEGWLAELSSELRDAGTAGKGRGEEFEQLVGDAFTRLGCEARWIKGGNDTDIEITSPVHAVVEAKSRSGRHGIRSINAVGIDKHREQRGADQAFVVGRHFPQQAIDEAETYGITTLTIDNLIELLELRERYSIPPERVFELAEDVEAFQEDRIDILREDIDQRKRTMQSMLSVLQGLERKETPLTAEQLHFILLGMADSEREVPDIEVISHTLEFLSHPTLDLLEEREGGYTLSTGFENATEVLMSFSEMVDKVLEETFSSDEIE